MGDYYCTYLYTVSEKGGGEGKENPGGTKRDIQPPERIFGSDL